MSLEQPISITPITDRLTEEYSLFVKSTENAIVKEIGCFCKVLEASQAGRIKKVRYEPDHPARKQGIMEQVYIDNRLVAQFNWL